MNFPRHSRETIWTKKLAALDYQPDPDQSVDFTSSDGTVVLQLLDRQTVSVRDLQAAGTRLAILLSEHPEVRLAALVIQARRLTPRRLYREWEQLLAVLAPGLSSRLGMVASGDGFAFCLPEENPVLQDLAELSERIPMRSEVLFTRAMPKFFSVLETLLIRWLLGKGPIPRGELGDQAGCSYPTVAKSIRQLGKLVQEGSDRSIKLHGFPTQAWGELLALVPSRRPRASYCDRSGQSFDALATLKRLRRLDPPGVALGGVFAAHHWDPDFDLRGVPRLDLTVEAEFGSSEELVHQLDAALGACGEERPPDLVVHWLRRPSSQFVETPGESLPFADPVETLLDLSELRLLDQANDLVRRLRKERTSDRP